MKNGDFPTAMLDYQSVTMEFIADFPIEHGDCP